MPSWSVYRRPISVDGCSLLCISCDSTGLDSKIWCVLPGNRMQVHPRASILWFGRVRHTRTDSVSPSRVTMHIGSANYNWHYAVSSSTLILEFYSQYFVLDTVVSRRKVTLALWCTQFHTSICRCYTGCNYWLGLSFNGFCGFRGRRCVAVARKLASIDLTRTDGDRNIMFSSMSMSE